MNVPGRGSSKCKGSKTEEISHIPEPAESQWGEQWGLWSVVRLKSKESDQTGPPQL